MKKMKIAVLLVTVISFMGLILACPDTTSPSQEPDQTPVAGDYDIGNLRQTEGSVTAVTITPKAGKSTGRVTILYDGSVTLPTTAGSYVVTFNVAAATGWTAASGLSAGTLVISPDGVQTPVVGDFIIDNLTQTVDNVTDVTITPKPGKSTGAITILYDGNAALPTAVGTYAVTFNVAEAEGWNAATGLVAGNLIIIPVGGLTPSVDDYDIDLGPFIYDGGIKMATIRPKTGKSQGHVTIKYDNSTTIPSEAGTYTVTFDVAAYGGWTAASGLRAGEMVINKPSPVASDFTFSGIGTYTYNGSPRTVTVTPKVGKSTGAVTVKYNDSETAPSAVGSYTVTFDVAAAGNWAGATGLSAGTLKINQSSGGGVVTPPVDPPTPATPGIRLSTASANPLTALSFGEHFAGYPKIDTREITVTSTSAAATGALTVTLSGDDADSFTLSTTSIQGDSNSVVSISLASITVSGDTRKFYVGPLHGLPVKDYSATVTVTGTATGINSPSFTLSFTVETQPTFGIEISGVGGTNVEEVDGGYRFKDQYEGYDVNDLGLTLTVTITNVGTQPVSNFAVALFGNSGDDFFVMSGSIPTSLEIGSDTSFTLKPQSALTTGGPATRTFNTTVIVTGDNGINEQFTVSFTVKSNNEFKVEQLKKAYAYTSSSIRPTIIIDLAVKNGQGETLTNGTDFELKFFRDGAATENVTDVGTVTVNVVGIDTYAQYHIVTRTFEIVKSVTPGDFVIISWDTTSNPTLSVPGGGVPPTVDKGGTLTITVSGGFTVVEWAVDGEPVAGPAGNTYPFTSPNPGKHNVNVVAKDANGRLYSATAVITVINN